MRLPSARARSWPWMLRSRMLLHSHSAMARVRWRRSWPVGVVVSNSRCERTTRWTPASVMSLMKRRPSTARRLMRSMAVTTRVSPACSLNLQVPQGPAVAPGARADLRDELVHAVVLELLGLGLQVALVLGGLADPGEADDEGKAGGHRRCVLPALSVCGNE